MKHLDLFSGIGGFAYAAQQVWGADYECVGFVEIDPYCQAVLKKRFPGVPIYGDIRQVTSDSINGGYNTTKSITRSIEYDLGKSFTKNEIRKEKVSLITGGFPCQPFSQAGRRKGTSDNRYLWPEMLRVISEVRPRWVIGENVSGIWNMVLNQVCLDLEAQGYDVIPFIIPACAVNAPHRRDRIWITAYDTTSDRCDMWECDRERGYIQETSIGKVEKDKQEGN